MAEPDHPKQGFFHSLLRILRGKPAVSVNLDDNPCLKMILERRSNRKFLSKPIPKEIIDAIVEAGRMAPSAVNLQTWTFVCFDPEEWENVVGSVLPFNGQYAILILSDQHRVESAMSSFDFPDEPLVLHTMSVFNTGLAAMNMTLAAEACGLSSIMLSETGKTGLLDVGMLYARLSLPDKVVPITTLVLGYRGKRLAPMPPKLPVDTICGFGDYPQIDKAAMGTWLADMKAGYRAMRPWSSFNSQVETYATKIHQAEVDLGSIIFSDE